MLECSAFLDWGNGFAAEQVEGYNFIGTFGESHFYVSEESFYAPLNGTSKILLHKP